MNLPPGERRRSSTPGEPGAPSRSDVFEAERPRLVGLAYRITGSLADAEDVVQDAWIRWSTGHPGTVDNAAAWLTTVTSRLALDCLRTQRRRREVYVGPWLPDPVRTPIGTEETAELAESLTLGFLVMLDALGPTERVAFLLGEVFGEPYPVIAQILGKREPACRQLVSRARRKIRATRESIGSTARTPASIEQLTRLMEAVLAGDEHAAVRLLDPDAVLVSDAGATRHAARRPLVGAARIWRHLAAVSKLTGRTAAGHPSRPGTVRVLDVNASPSLVLDAADGPIVITGAVHDGRLVSIWIRLNPDKTGRLDQPPRLV